MPDGFIVGMCCYFSLLSGKKENDFFSLYGSRQENSLLRKQNGITLEYYYFVDRVLQFKGCSLSRRELLK